MSRRASPRPYAYRRSYSCSSSCSCSLSTSNLLVAALVCLTAASAVGAHEGSSSPRYDDILPLSRVRAGMRGYGLTVFRGTKIERFEVEVLGVVRNGSLVAPGHDMILVRMTGGPMTSRKANLIRGMSGSPVYVNGKCVGAFSQGEPASKEPLGGVTPIEDMLEAWDPKLPSRPEALMGGARRTANGRTGHTIELGRPVVAGNRTIRRVVFDAPRAAGVPRRGTLLLRPCSSMVTVSGMHAAARRKLAALLAPYGVEVVHAASGGRPTKVAGASMRPGAAFSVMLLTGDVTSGATGTVTYRRGDRILGFGHPFLGVGPLNAPVCTAYVHDVYPLLSGSYKISTPGPVIGSLLQDRSFGVSAQVGKAAATISIAVTVDDRTSGRSKTFRIGAASHPNLYSGLVGLAVGSAIADVHGTPGPVTARVETTVEAETIGPISRTNRVFDARAIDAAVTGDLESILSVLATNPFEPLGIKRAEVRAVIEPGRRTATIERAFVSAGRYVPGQTVDIGVVVKPFEGAERVETIRLTVPGRCPDGKLTLTVQGGAPPPVASLGGVVFRPSTPAPADKAPPTNVRQMIVRLLEREAGNEISATLALPSASVAVDGVPLRRLPPTLDWALRSNRVSAIRTDRDEVRSVIATDWIVSGRHTLTLNVQKRFTVEPARKPGAQASPAAAHQQPASNPGSALDADFAFSVGQRPNARSSADQRGAATPSDTQAKQPTAPKAGRVAETPVPVTGAAADAPVARAARFWRHSSAKDWTDAEFHGLALSSTDELRLSPALAPVGAVPDALVWCVAPGRRRRRIRRHGHRRSGGPHPRRRRTGADSQVA